MREVLNTKKLPDVAATTDVNPEPMNIRRFISIFFIALMCCSSMVYAGFLEMPSVEEVPDFEEETMRLDLDIPNVRERNPDPQGDPRLNIREFRVQGIVEYPKLGITREELIRRVENIRFDLMREGQMLDSGYTEDEIGDVSDLLAEIEEDTKGEHVTTVELQRLVFLIREQRRNRGITLGMIESVADVITRYYREAGFILAKAYTPKQHVRDGVVTLTLLLGELGEVAINDNKRHSDRFFSRVFDDIMGKPITAKGVEERLYLINDMPGIASRGYFEPGSQVGDTKLSVNVIKEDWYSANVRIDNHGAPGSGEYRLYSDLFLYSPFGLADQLQVGVLSSYDPSNSQYGLIRYQTNIVHPRFKLYAGASTNDFVLDQQLTKGTSQSKIQYKGESFVVDGGMSWQLRRSRLSNHAIDLNLTQIESTIGLEDQQQGQFTDTIQNFALTYAFDFINEQGRRLHQGSVTLKTTEVIDSAQDSSEANANIFEYDYALLTFLPLPFSEAESRILVRSSGQYADASISSSVQFGLGGPMRARAFDVNKFYADSGAYLGVNWQFNGFGGDDWELYGEKFKDILQPFLFADASYGYKYPLLNSNQDVDAVFGDVGLGLKISFKGMRASLSFASALLNQTSTDFSTDDEKGSKLYFDVQYSF